MRRCRMGRPDSRIGCMKRRDLQCSSRVGKVVLRVVVGIAVSG